MSSYNTRASGGSKNVLGQKGEIMNTGLFISNTLAGKDKDVHMKHLDYLISNTTGIREQNPLMEGVITKTTEDTPDSHTPTIHKNHNKSKTNPRTEGQVPFAGSKY